MVYCAPLVRGFIVYGATLVREGGDETTTAALWALVLLSHSSEVRPPPPEALNTGTLKH